jgi:hypothetical protein
MRRTGATRLCWARKTATVRRYGRRPLSHLGYILSDPELENYNYDIANKQELVDWIDTVIHGGGKYVAELDQDPRVAEELRAKLRWRPGVKNRLHFGFRLGLYALVRALEPDVIVETGTHDGLGSVALLEALDKNGHGRLVSIDPRPGTGWLVPDRLRGCWRQVRATSYDALEEVGHVDVLVHDSLHVPECERFELQTAARLGARAIISGHRTPSPTFEEVCAELGVPAQAFREKPIGHFYPGGGIGVALLSRGRTH